MPTRNLVEETHALLLARPIEITYGDIAKATGLTVPWLQDFKCNKRLNASSHRIEKLRGYLLRQAMLRA